MPKLCGGSFQQSLEEEVYMPQQSRILEAKQASEGVGSEPEDQPMYFLCPLLTTQEADKEED